MNSIYVYKGQDITLDILMKTENVIRIIAEKERRNFDDCYKGFVDSKTYIALKNTDSVMWAESAEFIADEYFREKVSADIL